MSRSMAKVKTRPGRSATTDSAMTSRRIISVDPLERGRAEVEDTEQRLDRHVVVEEPEARQGAHRTPDRHLADGRWPGDADQVHEPDLTAELTRVDHADRVRDAEVLGDGDHHDDGEDRARGPPRRGGAHPAPGTPR